MVPESEFVRILDDYLEQKPYDLSNLHHGDLARHLVSKSLLYYLNNPSDAEKLLAAVTVLDNQKDFELIEIILGGRKLSTQIINLALERVS